MLARLFVIVGGLLVLVLLAALAVPPLIDWTGYRAAFEREASAVLGRKVTVQGDATARLLPFPSVTFADVAVAGGPQGQPAMTVDKFSMDAELAPFLRGEVLIFDMRLERPRATIAIAEDGTVDWAVRPSSPFDPGQIAIEKLTVSGGEVEVRHGAGGRVHTLSGIDATVSAKSLLGPWRVDGSMLFDGLRTGISASTGRVGDDGRMRLRLRARPESLGAVVESDGNAELQDGALVYAGQFKLMEEEAVAAQPPHDAAGPVVATPAKADPGYRASGRFQLDHRRLSVDEFRFETGPLDNPYAADGTALLDLGPQPRFRIEASGAQVQFDEAVTGGSGPALSAEARIAALERALQRLPRPTIPGSVNVQLPAVVTGDTTIRDVHLSAEPTQGGWLVHSLGAILPGRTTLEADGLLATGETFGFKGRMLLAVAQPSGFAAWLARDVDEAVRRLPAAGFSAEVDLTRARQTFGNLELILGGSRFTGRIEAVQAGDARPSVTLALDGGALDLEGLSALASIFVSTEGDNRFTGQDLDFDIKAGPVEAWGLSADKVDAALRLREGVLEVDRLALTGLAGASVSATGRISGFPHDVAGNLDAALVAVDLAPLIEALDGRHGGAGPVAGALISGMAARVRAYPDLLQDARIDAVVSVAPRNGSDASFALSAHGNAGASAFSASLSGKRTGADPLDWPLAATFDIRAGDATALMALSGLPSLPLGLVGPGAAEISGNGSLRGGVATRAALTGDDFRASFDGNVVATGQATELKGSANLEAADIEPWLMTAGVAIPGMGTGTSVSLRAEADYGNNLLILNGLSATVNETAVSGDLNATVKNGKPHLTGSLTMDEFNLDPLAAMLLGDAAFAPAAEGWPTAPFVAAAAAPASAELDISTAALAAGHLATAYDASFSLKLDDEGLRVSGLTGRLFGGALTGRFELDNSGGTGLLGAQMSVAGADLAALLPESGLSGTTDLSATLSTGGKSVDGMVTSLSGSGTASLKGLEIAGLNPAALPALLAAADEAGRDIDTRRTAAFAPAIVGQGSFAAQDAELAFTLANGVLRTPPLRLSGQEADISAEPMADLGAGTAHVQGTITYRAGDEALVGSEPSLNFSAEGPLSAMTGTLDSAPLAQFLIQRALEREQRRVEAMQAALLEKQRLRREVRYYSALQAERERAAEEERRRQEEALRKAEAEAQARQEQERLAREEEARAAKAAREAEAAERARREAEAARSRPVPEIERAPLPPPAPLPSPAPMPPANGNAPASKEPFTLDNLLKSLGGG